MAHYLLIMPQLKRMMVAAPLSNNLCLSKRLLGQRMVLAPAKATDILPLSYEHTGEKVFMPQRDTSS